MPARTQERAALIEEEGAELEADLTATTAELAKLDAERAKLIEKRDSLVKRLGKRPFNLSVRRLGLLGGMTHQNAALIVNPPKKKRASSR